MRKKLGDHPNLHKVIAEIKSENTLIEIDWMQKDQVNASRRRLNRERFERRAEWEEDLKLQSNRGMIPEEILALIDRMVVINKEAQKKK